MYNNLAAVELATWQRRAERWQARALSAERTWAGTAYALGHINHLRAQDKLGLARLVHDHAQYLAREWIAEPDAPSGFRRVTDKGGIE